MELLPGTMFRNLKEKRWIWRPLLLFSFVGLFLFVLVSDSSYSTGQRKVLLSQAPITKVELKVVSPAGVHNVVLTDRALLDSIDRAFKAAQVKKVERGKSFETWAEVNVYKGDDKVNLFIQHSAYNGWMIDVGNKTLHSEYLFALVRRYAQK